MSVPAFRWDVIVVGAGPTGTLVADRLRARGHTVLLLDAGPRIRRGERVREVDRREWPFSTVGLSFDWYRVRAVGGRGHIWGGWSYRLPESSLRRAGWPCTRTELDPYYTELEQRLNVVEGALDERYRRAALALEVSIVPKRAALGRLGHIWRPQQEIVSQAARAPRAALRFEHRAGRAEALAIANLESARPSSLRARAYVLAASPIETARVLLASELERGATGIGRNLVDHMVASYVLVEPAPVPPSVGRGPFPGAALVESFVNVDEATSRPYRGGFSMG
ncbi:MAG: NAD(P)-binding protein [Polyangiaceae bacterium]